MQVPAKGGGFGANYVLTRVCNVSGLEKPQTRVCGRVSKAEQKKGPPSEPSTYHTWHYTNARINELIQEVERILEAQDRDRC